MKKISLVAAFALCGNLAFADTSVMQSQIETLTKEIELLKKQQSHTTKSLTDVKNNTANNNVKIGLDFRNAIDVLEYKDNKNNVKAKNNSLLSSRLFLNLSASPMKGLVFKGKLAIYSTWGSKLYHYEDTGLKDWSASSKPSDTVMRLKEGYFAYNTKVGEQPITVSVGRRPASNGFLANMRENEDVAGSPLAHITNMEVNGAMVKLDWSRYIPGAYTKFVYGRAHTGEMNNVYGKASEGKYPYAITDEKEDRNVDFFVIPGVAYYDGQYELMYQWAHIFNTKGSSDAGITNAAAAGNADLFALSLKVEGIGNEINEFLDDTLFFISGASSYYNPKDGHKIFQNAGVSKGYSIWTGIVIPDMITNNGKIGFEYNHGSKHWTPMTWAEDSAIGSKVAVRGHAYEAYWNFDLFGVKYLPSQVRYTHVQHDYTPNVNCSGWIESEKADITAKNLRFFVSYRY